MKDFINAQFTQEVKNGRHQDLQHQPDRQGQGHIIVDFPALPEDGFARSARMWRGAPPNKPDNVFYRAVAILAEAASEHSRYRRSGR